MYEMRTEINLNIPKIIQPSFWNLANSRARFCVAYGGAGAGKSYAAAQKVIAKALKYPNRKIVCVRKYGPALRLTCYEILMKLLRTYQIPHRTNKTDMIIDLGAGSQILCIPIVNSTGEPAERLKSLTDVSDFWIEEPTELSYDEFKMIRLRLRGETLAEGYRQIIMTFNPIDRNHWLHKYFFEPDETGQLRESDRLKYTYRDNRFLDAEFIAELESLKNEDQVAYQVYALGDWGILTGQIYNNYVIEEFQHPIDFYDDVICGVDFGFENPSAWVLIGLREKTLHVIDEIYKRKLLNPEFIKLIQDKLTLYSIPRVEVICDYAEPARIEEMRRAGMNVHEALKNVVEGINVVKKYKIIIHPRCVEFSKEISGYRRKQDKNGNNLEEPVKFNDHLCFVEGTKVITVNGWKNIENIRCGDSILTRSGTHIIIASGQTGFEEVIKIKFSNGISLTGTGNHPIWIEGKGFMALDTLRYGDNITICTMRQSYSMESNFAGIQILKDDQTGCTIVHTQDILETGLDIYTKKYGKQNVEQFPKGGTSTTKMGIHLIIQSITWNVLSVVNIYLTILKNIMKNIKKNVKNILMTFVPSQKHGIAQRKVENGTRSTEKKHSLNESPSSKSVSVVEKNIMISAEASDPDFVQTIANPHGEGNKVTIMLNDSASFAEVNSLLTSMPKLRPVLENVTVCQKVKLNGKRIVYNLTVDQNHEYFANGVLVSNCDALRYACMRLQRSAGWELIGSLGHVR